MTKEQAIKRCKEIIITKFNLDYSIDSTDKEAIETVLSMLKENSAEIEQKNIELAEKNAEIEKKDKIIDLILDKVNLNYVEIFYNNEVKEIIEIYEKTKNTNNLSGLELRKSCIKQYFEQEATKMSQERNEEWKKI